MTRGKKIEKNIPQEELEKHDLVWIGEIHGVKENYDAYKAILPYFSENGFRNVLWEMRSDFSEKSGYTEDGRINPFSIRFLKWLKKQVEVGKIDKLTFFGNVAPKNTDAGAIGYEEEMASEVIDRIGAVKSVIITGNYHMMNLADKKDGEKSALDFVKEKSGLKILRIYLDYSKGTFYNFGYKKFAEGPDSEKDNLKFGAITRRGNSLLFHMGKVRAVFKNTTAK